MTLRLKLLTEGRSLARRVGLIRLLLDARARLSGQQEEKYEEVLRRAMEERIRPGDVVWDIGANVGLYTAIFADRVGTQGKVYAFEPAHACFQVLRDRTKSLSQVVGYELAVGSREDVMSLNVADDPLAATHSLAAPKAGGHAVDVRVASVDGLVERGEAPSPNVMKIDVEGFEEEVIDGAAMALRSPRLRAVFMEIHFGILDSRGRRQAPSSISDKLKTAGLKVTWLDSSHLMATR